MLKKTVKYENFNGEQISEDLYFHLSKAELVELEMSEEGGLSQTLEKVIESNNGKQIIQEFKKIIMMAYGKRSPDGRHFIKNQQLREEFESSEAYSTLFMELVTDAGSAAEFVNGVVPKDLKDDAIKITQANLAVVPAESDVRMITRADMMAMDADEFERATRDVAEGKAKLVQDN